MSVVPEKARRMITGNLNRVMQRLARHREHSDNVILWSIRRNGESMEVQVRHVHAGIHRTALAGLGGKIVDVGDFENVARSGTDDWRDRLAVKGEGIQAVFVHGMKRDGHGVILRSHLE